MLSLLPRLGQLKRLAHNRHRRVAIGLLETLPALQQKSTPQLLSEAGALAGQILSILGLDLTYATSLGKLAAFTPLQAAFFVC